MLNVQFHVILSLNYLTAYSTVFGQFPQAIPQPITTIPAREGKLTRWRVKYFSYMNVLHKYFS